MADKADEVFVAGPEGRAPTRDEAEAMAAALFDAIAKQRQNKQGETDK